MMGFELGGGVMMSYGNGITASPASSYCAFQLQSSSSLAGKRQFQIVSFDRVRCVAASDSSLAITRMEAREIDDALGLVLVEDEVVVERRASNAAAETINDSHSNASSHLASPDLRIKNEIPHELDPMRIPGHVAVIMDGNSRWAKQRGWPLSRGHEAGVKALREVIRLSNKWGIRVLTVYAFSLENWLRPKSEVDLLMNLFRRVMEDDELNMFKEEIRIEFIGDRSKLSVALQRMIMRTEEHTERNKGMKVMVALSYSGRNDIVEACRAIAAEVKEGTMAIDEINESAVSDRLMTRNEMDPDLVIRTSGEERLSNFLLWQLAYSEILFVEEHWPDFGEAEYKAALVTYQKRERRFGKHNHSH